MIAAAAVSGSIHAIRRELFHPAPGDLSFDMVHPLHVAVEGFKAVYELGQTTAAAEYLGLTQPAVSQALRRLRELTGDPLFVPSRSGMLPTPRASELSVPVNSALAAIQRALERNPDFQPATARRRFRLGMLDYGIMVLAPSVAGVISQHAPGIVVDIMHVPSANAHQILH